MTAETDPVVSRILWPVAVTLPSGEHLPLVKLVVTLARVYCYVGGDGGVVEAYSADQSGSELQPPWQGRGAQHTVTTSDGLLIAVNLGGCGCHAAALRAYRPFPEGPERMV